MTNAQDNPFKRLWKAWIQFGHWIGNIMSWVWMPLFYFIFALPFALAVKFFADPLLMKRSRQRSYWTPKVLPKMTIEWAKSQGSAPSPSSQSGQES